MIAQALTDVISSEELCVISVFLQAEYEVSIQCNKYNLIVKIISNRKPIFFKHSTTLQY